LLKLAKFFLRKVAYPQSQPPRIRGSGMGKWNWCAEQSRHLCLGLVPESEPTDATEGGTICHKVLEESMGRRFPWEDDFLRDLEKFQDPDLGFVRIIEGSKIYYNLTGHQDDLQITPDRTVSIVENKFVLNPNLSFIQRYKFCMAEFQTQIYAWIFDPIVQQLGGVMNRVHAVCFWNMNTFKHIHTFQVIYQPAQTEENILRCIKAFENPELILKFPPREWKCKYCSPEHKELCIFRRKENEKSKQS